MTQIFTTPMAPWPDLQPFANQVTIGGGKLFYYDTGANKGLPTRLLVHGLGDEADTWRAILPKAATQCRVIALDLPGFGRSDLLAEPVSIQAYENCLLALLEHLKLSRVTLVGHSLGAMLVQQFALQHPERAEGLMLVSGGLAAGKTPLSLDLLLFLIPGVGEWAYNRLRRDPQAAYQTLSPYYAHLDALPQAERDFLFQRVNQRVWSDKQRKAFLTTLRHLARWLPAQQKDLAQQLSQSDIPTRILWGAEDRIAPSQNAQLLASLYPPSNPVQVTIMPGAGHNLHQEMPDEVIRLIL